MNLKESKAELLERVKNTLAPFQSCYFIGDGQLCLWSLGDHRAIVDSSRPYLRKIVEELLFELIDITYEYDFEEGTRVFIYIKPRFCDVYPYKVQTNLSAKK